MKKILTIVISFAMCLGLLSACAQAEASTMKGSTAQDSTEVTLDTPSGSVLGLKTGTLASYKGIPYATAERFAPPQEIAPWTETLDCREYGTIMPQVRLRADVPSPTMSENSLNLNIWTPAAGENEKLPVYVWIHGGGFAGGSGAEPDYDGTAYANEGIVVVTINYRINALGYLATQETYNQYGTTGNWGLLDQVKALEWVQKNISAFGGDPNQVTIGGESAGAYAVSGMILSPLTEGLFQGAIMESGSMLGVPGNNQYMRGNLERSIEIGQQMLFAFNAEDNAEGLAKMRMVKYGDMVQLTPLSIDFTSMPTYMLTAVFDGYALPKDPYAALRNGQYNKVRLLWGYNQNEGALFIPEKTTQEKYEMLATKMYGYDAAQILLEHFPSTEEIPAYQRARNILMHGMFAAVMKPFGDAMAESGMDVYAYQFNYATQADKDANMAAAHSFEIVYAFGNLPADATAEQQAVSDEMFNRWVSFIKFGNPNQAATASNVEWGKYDPQSASTIIFDKNTTFGEMPLRDDMEYMVDLMFGTNGEQLR